MVTDRSLTTISVIAASIAAGASVFLGYVSWEGRNDYLKSVAVASIMKACTDFVHNSNRFSDFSNRAQLETFFGDVESLMISVMVIAPSSADAIKADLTRVHDFQRALPANAPEETSKPVMDDLQKTVDVECLRVMRLSIGMAADNAGTEWMLRGR
jgi:hypothetical protein